MGKVLAQKPRKPNRILFPNNIEQKYLRKPNQFPPQTHKRLDVAPKPQLRPSRIPTSAPGLCSNATISSELLFKHVIAFLKANPKLYNLSKICFKKRFFLRDMCAQRFLIKFERQSTSLYFIAYCSRLINTINKCDNFLER